MHVCRPLGSSPGPYKVAAVGSDGVPDNSTVIFTVPATGVTVAWDTGVSTYTVLPYDLVFSVSVVNANISTFSTQLWLNVSDSITGVTCVSNSISGLVADTSALTEDFGVVVDTTYFTNVTTACPDFLSDTGTMTISATVNNATNGVASSSASKTTSFVLSTPTSLLKVGPTAGAPTTYTLSAVYTSQYVGKVQLSIFTPTGGLAFSTNLRWNGTTPTTATWLEATAGLYPYTLSVFAAFGTYSSSGSIAVSGQYPGLLQLYPMGEHVVHPRAEFGRSGYDSLGGGPDHRNDRRAGRGALGLGRSEDHRPGPTVEPEARGHEHLQRLRPIVHDT